MIQPNNKPKEKDYCAGLTAYVRMYEEVDPCGIPCVRVSSAKARGRAAKYAYWGVAKYRLRRAADGDGVVCAATGRAKSDRRSERLAWQDARDIARTTACTQSQHIGRVRSQRVAYEFLCALGVLRD